MKVGLNLIGSHTLFDGEFEPILDIARLADRKGIDVISMSDHLAISRVAFEEEQYQGMKFPFPRDYAWYEPIAFLTAVAAVTRRVHLSANVFIAPLRSPILMAKQLATLDVISKGRVEIGIGAGWQKQEFDASNVPFEGRFGYMEEQVEACRLLWGPSPASYHGRHVNFDELYAHPKPVQGAKLPVWFGLAATERNVERIARLSDGWLPPPYSLEVVAEGIRKIKAALPRYGRSFLPVRALLAPATGADGIVDVDATFAKADEWKAIGATELETSMRSVCRDKNDVEKIIDKLVALRDRLA